MFILLFNFANLCNHNILRRINTTLLGEPRPRFPFSPCHSLSLCVLKMSLKRRMGVHTGRGWGGQEGCGALWVASEQIKVKDSKTVPVLPCLAPSLSISLSLSLYILNQRLTMSFPWAMGGTRGRGMRKGSWR